MVNLVSFVKAHRIDVIIVLALFLLAFGVRSVPSDKFKDVYGFDSFWAARMTHRMIDQGWAFPFNDSITDYPYGRITNPVESGWWAITAVSYKLVALFNGTQGFSYALFAGVFSWLNALLGSLAIPALYLFGKKAFNRITGLTAALVLSGSGSHLFYSIYGHAENDATGLLLFFTSFFLLAWTVKSRDKRVGALFAFTLAWLSITWQAYLVVVLLAAGAFTLYFLAAAAMQMIGMHSDSTKRAEQRRWMVYSLLLMLPSILATKFVGVTQWDPIIILPVTVAIMVCSFIELWISKQKLATTTNVRGWPWQQKALTVAAVFLVISVFLIGMLAVKAPFIFAGVMSEPRNVPQYAFLLDQTIAEQNPIPGEGFFGKLGTLAASGFGNMVWFALFGALIAIAKLFVMPFARKDFRYEWDLLALGFILFSMLKLTSVNQTTFFLGAALAFGTGYFFGQLYNAVNYLGKQLKTLLPHARAAAYVVVMLLFFSYNTIVTANVTQYNYDIPGEWFQTFAFLNGSGVANGSVVTPWWDYGHWLLYYNGDKIRVSSDNVHGSPLNIWTTARAFTHTTGKDCYARQDVQNINCPSTTEDMERAELEALEMMRPMRTTHVLIDKEIVGGGSGGKFNALEHIAQNNVGCFQAVGCQVQSDGGGVCPIGQNQEGQMVGARFNKTAWEGILSARWPGTSLNDQGIPTRAFVKSDSSGYTMYLSALACGSYFTPHPLSPSLFAFEARLFFDDPNLRYVHKVFDNAWNVIYEVDWNAVDAHNAGGAANSNG